MPRSLSEAETTAQNLNSLLAYARVRVDGDTDQGYFRFGYSIKHELSKQADGLRQILIDMGYVRNCKRRQGHNTLWWIKPEGQITADQVLAYWESFKQPPAYPPEPLLVAQNAALTKENATLRREIAKIRDQIDDALATPTEED
jgi:hypothetical protein